MGDVSEISAATATLGHERIEVEDVAVAAVKFRSGALGTIEASTAVFPGYLKKIAVHGDQGSAMIEEEDIVEWSFACMTATDQKIRNEFADKTTTGGGAADPAAIGHAAHAAQFRDVFQAIRAGGQPEIDGREGRRSVEVILAIYQSASTGRRVSLPL